MALWYKMDLSLTLSLLGNTSHYKPVPQKKKKEKRYVTILACPVEVLRGSENVSQCHTTLRGPDRVESGSLYLPRPVKTEACCVAKLSRLISDRTPTSHQRRSHQRLVQPEVAK